MATSEATFKLINDKLINLIKFQFYFSKFLIKSHKCAIEFRNCSNADKVKLYESVRKSLGKLYEDEPEAFGHALGNENSYKDLDDLIRSYFHRSYNKI